MPSNKRSKMFQATRASDNRDVLKDALDGGRDGRLAASLQTTHKT